LNPFIFMPEVPSSDHRIHLERYRHFIWSRLFRQLPPNTLTNKHHIVPVSFGMAKGYIQQPWNIIKLSLREHYLAHWMLWKAFQGQSMGLTFWFISHTAEGAKLNSREYAALKQEIHSELSTRFRGRIYSLETLEKMRIAAKQRVIDYPNPMLGKHHSNSTREKIGEKAKGRKASEETKSKLRGRKRGPRSKETCRKLSEANKGKSLSEAQKRNMSLQRAHKMIVNDGIRIYRIEPVEISTYLSQGYQQGYVNKKPKGQRAHNKGKVWVTDGAKNIVVSKENLTSYLEKGYKEGMTKQSVSWNKGLPMSEEAKKKLSKSQKERLSKRRGHENR